MPGANHLVASHDAGVHGCVRFRVFHPKANCASWISHRADAQVVPRRGMELTFLAERGENDLIGLFANAPDNTPALDSGGNGA